MYCTLCYEQNLGVFFLSQISLREMRKFELLSRLRRNLNGKTRYVAENITKFGALQ